jgi:hypothetical protein
MRILNRENKKGKVITTVSFENKEYVRILTDKFGGLNMNQIVQWRNKKTNHILNSSKHGKLEEIFKTVDKTSTPKPFYNETKKGPANLVSSGTTMFFGFDKVQEPPRKTVEEIALDGSIRELCNAGRVLEAVKFYKDKTGLGLKEAKDYVDSIRSTTIAAKQNREIRMSG